MMGSTSMKIELDNEILYPLKDTLMVEFLIDDLDTITTAQHTHPDDIKEDINLINAYITILKYYGVDNG
jgi:hypothetical protein